MELYRRHVVALGGRAERHAVLTDGGRVVDDRCGIRVREVDLRSVGDAPHQSRGLRHRQRIPADVGNLERAWGLPVRRSLGGGGGLGTWGSKVETPSFE